MERETHGRNDFFGRGDPFGKFRGFGLMHNLFGGRDPFDDPFFTRPFGSMFDSSRFKPGSSATDEVLHANRAKEVVIEELTSDDEGEQENMHTGDEKKNKDQKHIGSSKEPSVEHPDDDPDEGKSNQTEGTEPQARSFSFQTSKVTYGGVNGAYYTSTRSRRTDGDGVVIEESKEADKTTGQATHRISRGIHDKGRSATRKLSADGKVDMIQTLHNLNEDELAGFEEAWKGNVKGQLPGWSDQFDMHGTTGSSSSQQNRMVTWGGWARPSIKHSQSTGGRGSDLEASTNSSRERTKKAVRINIE